MKISIAIKGSAICYLDNNFWNVVFITDSTHLLKFTQNGTTMNLRESGLDRHITVIVDNAVNSVPEKGANFNQILNMASTEMHDHNRLEIKRKHIRNREIVTMMIPTGTLDRKDLTELNYFVEQIIPPRRRLSLHRQVAASVKIDMELREGKGLSIVIQDGEKVTTLPFPFEQNRNISFEFDNDCGEQCKQVNDFFLYYDWVRDKDRSKKFIAGKDAKILGRQGNCDPVAIDPPPSYSTDQF